MLATSLVVSALLAGTAALSWASEDGSTWDRYQIGTLAGVVKQVSDIGNAHDDGLSTALESDYPTKVRVQYTGEKRKIPAPRKTNIDTCLKASGVTDQAAGLFQNEILFKEGNTTYWIPVQNHEMDAYQNELKPGQMTDLYVVLVGLEHKSPKRFDCYFLANDFEPVHGEAR